MATLEDYLFTKNTKWLLWAVLICLVALFIFLAGVSVGERRVERGRGEAMSGGWTPPYIPHVSMPDGFENRGHGAIGTVASVSSTTITLTERDGSSILVALGSTTPLMGKGPAIAPGDVVVVIGDPATINGERGIEARFVRVFSSATSTSMRILKLRNI